MNRNLFGLGSAVFALMYLITGNKDFALMALLSALWQIAEPAPGKEDRK